MVMAGGPSGRYRRLIGCRSGNLNQLAGYTTKARPFPPEGKVMLDALITKLEAIEDPRCG